MHPIDENLEAELRRRFTYHPPQPGQPERYTLIREEAHELAREICLCCPDGRERSLALTALQEAVMWANAAIACGEGG